MNFQVIEIYYPNQLALSVYVYTFGQNPNTSGIDLRYLITAHNIDGKNENLNLNNTLSIIAIQLLYNVFLKKIINQELTFFGNKTS